MKFNHILSGLALTAAVLAAGCQKSLEYSDVVYFTGTENSNITNMSVSYTHLTLPTKLEV